MTHGAGQQQELERFFGGLSEAVEAKRERRHGRNAVLQQELKDFFSGLGSGVEAEGEVRRYLQTALQQELRDLFSALNQIAQAKEKRSADVKRDLTAMFGLLEPTIAAARVYSAS